MSRLEAVDSALGALIASCVPPSSESSPSLYAPVVAQDSKTEYTIFRLAGSVSDGTLAASDVFAMVKRHAVELAEVVRAHRNAQGGGSVPRLPDTLAPGPMRLEAVCRAHSMLLTLTRACWQRYAADVEQAGSGQAPGEAGSSGSGGAASRAQRGGPAAEPSLTNMAELADVHTIMWGASVSLAQHSFLKTNELTRAPAKFVDPVLRVATCMLSCLHQLLDCVDSPPAPAGGGGTSPPRRMRLNSPDVAKLSVIAARAVGYVERLMPDAELGVDPRRGHLGSSPAARRAAAALKPFPAWRHAPASLPFLEQANRLIPRLQRILGVGRGSGVEHEGREALQDVLAGLSSACTNLYFMLACQKPRPGEGGPKLEQRIASLAATGAKLARRLEADGYTGGMWVYINTCLGSCAAWLTKLRMYGATSPDPQAQEQLWRDMYQPEGKLAALAYVYGGIWPLAQRHQLEDAWDENAAMAAALLTNIAGRAVAEQGGLALVARQLMRCKDTIRPNWPCQVVCALHYACKADTQLYCWLARDGVTEAVAATAAALSQRPLSADEQAVRSMALDYCFNIVRLTARKADELTGARSHLAADLEAWVERQLERTMRQQAAALGPAFPLTNVDMFMEAVLGQEALWREVQRTFLPPILSALRALPHGGCHPPEAGEAAAARDRACAWLGCSYPSCTNVAGPSEAALPLMRCARCRVPGYCCTACQRADWKRHKLACPLLSQQGQHG